MTMASVIRKEFREFRRDRRVIFGTFITPLLMIFLMVQMFATIEQSLGKSKGSKVGVVASKTYAQLSETLGKTPGLTVVSFANLSEARKELEAGNVRSVVVFPDTAITPENPKVPVDLYFTSDETTSMVASSRVQAWAEATNKVTLGKALETQGLPADLGEIIKVKTEDVAKTKGAGESLLVSMLPYLVVLFMFAGGMAVSSDLVAGEKERGTLETLLVSPLTRMQVAMGKLISIVILSMTTGIVNVVGLYVIGMSNPSAKKMMFSSQFGVTPLMIGGILLVVLSLAFMFAAVQLAISAQSKNMREAQTYMAVANIFVLIPAVLSQIIGMTDLGRAAWVQWAPVLNTAICMRESLLGKSTLMTFVAPAVTNLVVGGIAMFLALSMFRKETILVKS